MYEPHKRAYRHPKYKTSYRVKNWPPRKDAVLFDGSSSCLPQRDRHIAAIQRKGLSRWRRESRYYRQSQAENAFSRYKRIIGERLKAKNDEAQERETAIDCGAVYQNLRDFYGRVSA